MAGALYASDAAANAKLDAWLDLTDTGGGPGKIVVYSGDMPATPDTALSGNTVLVTFACAVPAWAPAASRSKALDADPDLTATATASGTATFARVLDVNDTVIAQGAVATSGAAFTISTTAITSGGSVSLLSGTVTEPASP